MKRLLALFLSVVMILGMVNIPVFATSEGYVIDGDSVVIINDEKDENEEAAEPAPEETDETVPDDTDADEPEITSEADTVELDPPSADIAAEGEETATWDDETFATVDDLLAFAAAVNAGDTFAGKIVVLANDITFTEGDYWYYNTDEMTAPTSYVIQNFAGTFDGNDHAIKGLKFQNTDITKNPAMYIFNSISGTVKNLTLDGVDADINDRDCFGFIAYNNIASGL